MTSEMGWRFPPTNGGRVDGFNDPGIAYFTGAPLSSLARETIQNSLDARGTLGIPVNVSFELVDLSPKEIGRDELSEAISACRQIAEGDPMAERGLHVAGDLIEGDSIPCLRVSDSNTTGLRGDQWRTLVKMQGVSLKPEVEGAGGSHGIGKYAPFAVSDLRTVFYWTCYQESGNEVEHFQGKSVLMSHRSTEGETQGTGFYGIKEECREISGLQIPISFRVLDMNAHPVLGTCLTIAGFRANQYWRRDIAASVVENFFYAIHNGNLVVIVEPDSDSNLLEIDQTSLGEWFARLLEEGADQEDADDENGGILRQAQTFWQIVNETEPTSEKQDADLGHCRLWIREGEGLPSKVALVRRTGMLVTTEQKGLIRFPGFKDFAALCVFEDPAGNELLRRMENPLHDRFEPHRLPDEEQQRGRRALNRITRWIRDEIREVAGPPEGIASTVLSELAVYLPDPYPEEPFEDVGHGSDGTGEPGFGDRVKLTLRPVRRPTPRVLPPDDQSEDEGDAGGSDTGSAGGAGTGENGSGGGSGGSGDDDGTGGSGDQGGGLPRRRRIPISNVRILPIEGSENHYQLSFQASGSGVAQLNLEEAGDSSTIRRDDIRSVDNDVTLDRFTLASGERGVVNITADAPISGRAWRLSAIVTERE